MNANYIRKKEIYAAAELYGVAGEVTISGCKYSLVDYPMFAITTETEDRISAEEFGSWEDAAKKWLKLTGEVAEKIEVDDE